MVRRREQGDEVNQEIRKLYVDESLSLNKISSLLSIHPQVIKRRLKEMGVEVRTLSKAMTNFYSNRGGEDSGKA